MQKFYKQAFSTSMLMLIGACFGRPCLVWAESLKDEAIPQDRQGAIIQNRIDGGNATADSAPLQGKVERKHSSGFSLFGRRWTSEEYRNLNYGILGVVMVRHPFSKTERVAQVFPDCPAALAGIKPGDIVVKYADHVVDGHENQRTTWHTADGIAGTHVDYTVRRRGQLITFDLIRMNIEDIPNSSIRRMYERMLRDLGPPGVAEETLRKRHNEE
ncbi:MAG: PDZ domain-containing protein [Cyanobacteria bacterium SZAS LIN-5]|nr:PDZ domain-containing protein [Cyanobacteria bacterium SZAS LIN-5]